MKRRDALRTGVGLAVFVSLSGCSSTNDGSGESDGTDGEAGTSVRTTTPRASSTPTSTVERTRDHTARFREFVESGGIAVRELRVAGPVVTLGYATGSTDYRAVSEDIGRIAGGFFREVRAGWNSTRLEATVLDSRDTPLATWYARAEWFRRYQREEISGDELSLKVLRTVERTDTTGTATPNSGARLE